MSKARASSVFEPAGQSMHAAFAEAALYLPFAHSTHVSSALPCAAYPCTHRQPAAEGDLLNCLQSRQSSTSFPLVSLYLPVPHAEHAFATTGVE